MIFDLPVGVYCALLQSRLMDRFVALVGDRELFAAWALADEAVVLAEAVECHWCGLDGVHIGCWTPALRAQVGGR